MRGTRLPALCWICQCVCFTLDAVVLGEAGKVGGPYAFGLVVDDDE
jgi:hypothetical protein